MREKWLILTAIVPMFQSCGTDYINAWLKEWLESAKAAGVYEGPTSGMISDLDLDEILANSVKQCGLGVDYLGDIVKP